MLKKCAILLGVMLILAGCGDLYEPQVIERTKFEGETEDDTVEAIKARVKAEYEEKKNDERYPVVLGVATNNMKFGYINDQGGLVIGPVYDSAGFFKDGMAIVSAEGEYFVIDINGEVIIDDNFDSISQFSEGFAMYTREVEGERRIGFVTPTGLATDIPGYSGNVYDYNEGIAVVKTEEGYTFMRPNGSLLTEEVYEYASPFSEGMALVSDGDDYGYINSEGELVIPMEYSFNAESTFYNQGFHNGLAAVRSNGAYGYINKQNDMVIEPQFDYGSVFSDRRASVDVGEIDYYINTSGEKPFEAEYEYASSFENGYAFVKFPSEEAEEGDQAEYLGFKIINTKGEVVVGLNIQYDHGGGYTFPSEWTTVLENDVARIVYHSEDGIHFAYVDLTTGELIWSED